MILFVAQTIGERVGRNHRANQTMLLKRWKVLWLQKVDAHQAQFNGFFAHLFKRKLAVAPFADRLLELSFFAIDTLGSLERRRVWQSSGHGCSCCDHTNGTDAETASRDRVINLVFFVLHDEYEYRVREINLSHGS